MSLPVILRRQAQVEFDDAADWYEQRRLGRGVAFTVAVKKVLMGISSNPDFYPEVYNEVRKAVVSGYPYAVYYRVTAGQVWVLAIFHAARDPSVWQGRSSP